MPRSRTLRCCVILAASAGCLAVGGRVAAQQPPGDGWVEPPAGQVVPARYGEPAALPSDLELPADLATPRQPAPTPGGDRSSRYESAGQELARGASQPAPTSPAPLSRSYSESPAPRPRAEPRRAGGQPGLSPVAPPKVERARVSKGAGRLPNDAGQVWREYDIRPYTQRVAGADQKPQQRIVDWVLRETGYEAWHSDTFGILNASPDTLTVYHTPAMQAIVTDIVDRFVNHRAAAHAFSMRIMTVRNPDWRVRALGLMSPIEVQSPGLQGWTLAKENYALLMSELARRGDVRDYTATGQLVPNGQASVFSTMRPRGYIKGVLPTQNAWPGYQPEPGQLEEGASLEFVPLLSMGLDRAEALIKLRMNQVERMRRVSLDLPSPQIAGSTGQQRMQIEVPQLTMANLHERFRWPADQVLLLSMGMVATPGPDDSGTLNSMLPEAMKAPPRADALLFVQVQDARTPTAGPAATEPGRVNTASRPAASFSGRY
ncbi:hypothetical protein [Botrimarina sp.]|uniref:hypothetical protein n=1 Tax=Botrimarina sp. TaxID=2795802 RepID=UPI0032EDC736